MRALQPPAPLVVLRMMFMVALNSTEEFERETAREIQNHKERLRELASRCGVEVVFSDV